jgi:small subunit ribosomal protein S6e
MVEFKLNIGDTQTGKSYKKDLTADESKELLGKKLGEKISGNKIGFSNYEFQITGGSDNSGFPMRPDVQGTRRNKILITTGLGNRKRRKGMRLRRTVAGNTIGNTTVQINLKVLKSGKTPLGGEPAEATPEGEAPAEKKE